MQQPTQLQELVRAQDRQARLLPLSTLSRCLAEEQAPLQEQEEQAVSSRIWQQRSRRCSSFSRSSADLAELVREAQELVDRSSRLRSGMRCVRGCSLPLPLPLF